MKELDKIKRLSTKVIRILGLNPGPFTLQGTNCYLLGSNKERILIDTGEDKPGFIDLLDQVLSSEKAIISKIILTHWHYDHVGGLKSILKHYPHDIKVYKNIDKDKDKDIINYLTDINQQEVKVDGVTVMPIYTPGHTDDHICLLFKEESNLFSGDCILGEGTTIFSNLKTYLESLNLLLKYEFNSIYPAHGDFILEGKAKVNEYIEHRMEREEQIVDILKGNVKSIKHKDYNNNKVYFSYDIVCFLYKGYPKQVYQQADKLITLHLDKLFVEEKVKKVQFEDNDPNYQVGWYWIK